MDNWTQVYLDETVKDSSFFVQQEEYARINEEGFQIEFGEAAFEALTSLMSGIELGTNTEEKPSLDFSVGQCENIDMGTEWQVTFERVGERYYVTTLQE